MGLSCATRFAPFAAIALVLGVCSTADAEFEPRDPVPPTTLQIPAPTVPTLIPVADASPQTAKPASLSKLYEPDLTSQRPVRYGGLRCNKPRGCFQKATLFEWSVGCDPGKSDEGAEGSASEPGEEDRLTSDRPDFTEASSTVGRGRVQLESGYTYTSDRSGGARARTHSYPEVLLRIGLFADWFELRVGQNVISQSTQGGRPGGPLAVPGVPAQPVGGAGGVGRITDIGASDLYLGAKLALTQQKGVLPETAIILQGTVPTGAAAFTADRVLYGFNYLFSWELNDSMSLAGSFAANKNIDDNGFEYALLAQSLSIGYTLTDNLTAYTEWFAFYPTFATATGGGAQHYLDGGFQYFVTKNFALDIRAGVGLSRSADDFFTGVGFVVRY